MPEHGAAPLAQESPLLKIQELKGKGWTNNQIIQDLQRQGFTSTQIFDALSKVTDRPAPLNNPGPVRDRMDPMPQPSMFSPQRNMSVSADTEEMIEAVIDEKWNDLMADINKVIAWKESTENRIAKLEQQLTDVRSQMDKLQGAVLAKVGEYDQHILDVGAEVKAMEKVFSKVLPVFTDNVAELSRITDNVKRNAVKK